MNRKKAEFDLSFATFNEVNEIEALLYPYFQESTYSGLTYDSEAAKQTILHWIPEVCVLARVNGELVGIVSMYFINTFYKEPECDVVMFYVKPEYRGSGVARGLVNAITMIADRNKAGIIYTSSGSGIGKENNNLYANLFKKFGFKDLGTELIRINV